MKLYSFLRGPVVTRLKRDIRMIRRILLAAAIALVAIAPVYAKNLAIPEKNPTATIAIPDAWDVEEIEFGYSVSSPDDDVLFSIEYVSNARVDKLIASNEQWMKEQGIVRKGKPKESEISIGGISATLYEAEATDPDGDTMIDFIIFPAGNNRIVQLILWASKEAREENDADIGRIIGSLKAIN